MKDPNFEKFTQSKTSKPKAKDDRRNRKLTRSMKRVQE